MNTSVAISLLFRTGLITGKERETILKRREEWISNNPKKKCKFCDGVRKIIRM